MSARALFMPLLWLAVITAATTISSVVSFAIGLQLVDGISVPASAAPAMISDEPMSKPKESAPSFRYQLHVEFHPTDAGVLRDALDGEPFGLRRRLGDEELHRMIDAFAIDVDATSDERWDDFENDVKILSVYLPQLVEGREIEIVPGPSEPTLAAWKVLGRRGETARLALDVGWNAEEAAVVVGDEDVLALEQAWPALPEWVRTSLQHKFPQLASL